VKRGQTYLSAISLDAMKNKSAPFFITSGQTFQAGQRQALRQILSAAKKLSDSSALLASIFIFCYGMLTQVFWKLI
jgi:hypothetical protein